MSEVHGICCTHSCTHLIPLGLGLACLPFGASQARDVLRRSSAAFHQSLRAVSDGVSRPAASGQHSGDAVGAQRQLLEELQVVRTVWPVHHGACACGAVRLSSRLTRRRPPSTLIEWLSCCVTRSVWYQLRPVSDAMVVRLGVGWGFRVSCVASPHRPSVCLVSPKLHAAVSVHLAANLWRVFVCRDCQPLLDVPAVVAGYLRPHTCAPRTPRARGTA